LLKQHQINQVILSVGYLSRFIKDEFAHDTEGLSLSFSEDDRPLGTAGSLKKAQKFLKTDFFVINGDTYLDIDYKKLMTTHLKTKALITLVGTTQRKKGGGTIIARNRKVIDFQSFSEAKPPKNSHLHAGVYVMSPRVFKYIPSQTKFSIEKDLLPKLLAKQEKIMLYPVSKQFIDIGSPEEYQQALKKLK
jgi:D-glycero-alpha-D-manno-heptose 1-phosphate guanylyltransferase